MAYHTTAIFSHNFTKLSQMAARAITRQVFSPIKLRCVLEGGFPYDSFNARAMLTSHSVMRIFEWVRVTGFWGEKGDAMYLDVGKLEDKLVFIVAADLNLEPELYNTETDKLPITLDMQLVATGKSSFKNRCDLYLPSHSKPLATQNLQCVFINAEKRRPEAPPEWWLEKFASQVPPGEKALRVPEISTPDLSLVAEIDYIVGPSDLDPYCHLSSAYFIKVCTDSYIQWHIKTYGYFDNGDPFRNTKYMVQNFKGEAAIGEVINVRFWPSAENENVFTFILTNKGNVISETILEFYPLVKNSAESKL